MDTNHGGYWADDETWVSATGQVAKRTEGGLMFFGPPHDDGGHRCRWCDEPPVDFKGGICRICAETDLARETGRYWEGR